jgi:hypothetical protein
LYHTFQGRKRSKEGKKKKSENRREKEEEKMEGKKTGVRTAQRAELICRAAAGAAERYFQHTGRDS